jgi:hypothetical protein
MRLTGIFLLFAVILVAACSKPNIVGSDLLDDERAIFEFSDDFEFSASTVLQDSVRTYTNVVEDQLLLYLLGEVNDPIFGKSSSSLYLQPRLGGDARVLIDPIPDSVVLTLVLDTLGRYGLSERPMDIQVFRMTENPPIDQEYFSNDEFPVEEEPLGELINYVPNFIDSVEVYIDGDTVMFPPHIRIKLENNFAKEIRALDSVYLMSVDSFQSWIKGLYVRVSDTENSMLGINLNSAFSNMTVHYIDIAGFEASYDFIFNFDMLRMTRFEHDYSGAQVEPFIENQEKGDSLIFVQSMSGLNGFIEIDGLNELGNVLVNHAVLEFYQADLPNDNDVWYPPVQRMVALEMDNDGALVNSRDVDLAEGINNISGFGGAVRVIDENNPEESPVIYEMIVTAQVQDIVNGNADNKIFLSSYLKANFPNRVVLYGPGHPDYPVRLKVTYTKVQ